MNQPISVRIAAFYPPPPNYTICLPAASTEVPTIFSTILTTSSLSIPNIGAFVVMAEKSP
jgi:hypothetical protein